MQEDGDPSTDAASRLLKAVELVAAGRAPYLVVSGGAGSRRLARSARACLARGVRAPGRGARHRRDHQHARRGGRAGAALPRARVDAHPGRHLADPHAAGRRHAREAGARRDLGAVGRDQLRPRDAAHGERTGGGASGRRRTSASGSWSTAAGAGSTSYLPVKLAARAVVPQSSFSSPLSLSPLRSIVNCSTLASSFDDGERHVRDLRALLRLAEHVELPLVGGHLRRREHVLALRNLDVAEGEIGVGLEAGGGVGAHAPGLAHLGLAEHVAALQAGPSVVDRHGLARRRSPWPRRAGSGRRRVPATKRAAPSSARRFSMRESSMNVHSLSNGWGGLAVGSCSARRRASSNFLSRISPARFVCCTERANFSSRTLRCASTRWTRSSKFFGRGLLLVGPDDRPRLGVDLEQRLAAGTGNVERFRHDSHSIGGRSGGARGGRSPLVSRKAASAPAARVIPRRAVIGEPFSGPLENETAFHYYPGEMSSAVLVEPVPLRARR